MFQLINLSDVIRYSLHHLNAELQRLEIRLERKKQQRDHLLSVHSGPNQTADSDHSLRVKQEELLRVEQSITLKNETMNELLDRILSTLTDILKVHSNAEGKEDQLVIIDS